MRRDLIKTRRDKAIYFHRGNEVTSISRQFYKLD